jgi:DNA-directed RNA polymerase subunit alpha
MAVIPFQKPEKVVMQKASDFLGSFEFSPLEKGYGTTIGNSLRRILLSSLEGYAITSIKMTGVDHEFSTVDGMIEDMTDVILNLKQVRLKSLDSETSEKIFLTISGKDRFQAGDINRNANHFTVLNPELVICNLNPELKLDVELTVNKGRGYVPSEDNKPADAPIGLIPIDAIYSPIKRVSFNVENTRVGQITDYEKLTVHVETDGSIHPEEALKSAANLLIQHFRLFSEETITIDTEGVVEETHQDEEFLQTRKLLKTPLTELDLSVRAYNCLRAADIKTLGELVSFDIADMLKFRNFGKKSLSELEDLVREKGLTFGMDVTPYRLDED